MKKAINITLNGVIFNIEEDAYNKLSEYLESIKEHYISPEEEEEILSDIESSIAEKFSAKINAKKKVVAIDDVEEVIKIMGTVEEFDEPEDSNPKFEGKKQNQEEYFHKKLYRNPDDQIIAGVCSGLAAYFGIDPTFVRLFFAAFLLVGFSSVFIYLVLWIIMPEAKTNAQKLEMRGNPVNLKKIEQAVKKKSKTIKEESKNTLSKSKNSIKKVIAFPILVFERIVSFTKKILKKLYPALSIFFGIIMIVSTTMAMTALMVLAGFLIFNINSPYIISDIPLREFAGSVYYYTAVASVYFVVTIPLIFLLILGITLARRRSSFRMSLNIFLVVVWMLAIVGAFVSVSDLGPRVYFRMSEIEKEEQASANYDYKDFNKIYLGENINAEIKRGEEFAVNASGRKEDLDRLVFNIEEGQLQITQKEREGGKLCLFCFDRDVQAQIILPELKSYVGIQNSEVLIKNFYDDVYVSLGESAKAQVKLLGQNMNCSLAGVTSQLSVSGDVKDLNCDISGHARLKTEDLKIENIELKQDAWSRVVLDGEALTLKAELKKFSRLDAFEMKTNDVLIKVSDASTANVDALNILEAYSEDHGNIFYNNAPEKIIKKVSGRGVVEHDNDYIISFDDFEFEHSKDGERNTVTILGNEHLDRVVQNYLLSQKYFSWKTESDSKNFCVFEKLDEENGLFPFYLWARCGEFVMDESGLVEKSGVSVPVKIDYPNELSFYDLKRFSYQAPRDGALYAEDIKEIFPESLLVRIADYDSANINKVIIKFAEDNF